MRFAGIVSMVVYHGLIWIVVLDIGGELESWRKFWWFRHLHWIAVPALWLPLLAGTTLAQRARPIFALVIGGFFLALATLGNLTLWSEFPVWRWDILHFLGVSFLVFGLAEKSGVKWLVPGIGVAALVLSIFFQPQLQVAWPLLPWFSLFALGTLLGRRSRKELPIGIVLLIAGFSFPSAREWLFGLEAFRSEVFSPPFGVVVALAGGYLMALGVLKALFRVFPWAAKTPEVVASFSYSILWIFLAHLLVGLTGSAATFEFLGARAALFFYPAYLFMVSWAIARLLWAKRHLRFVVYGKKRSAIHRQ